MRAAVMLVLMVAACASIFLVTLEGDNTMMSWFKRSQPMQTHGDLEKLITLITHGDHTREDVLFSVEQTLINAKRIAKEVTDSYVAAGDKTANVGYEEFMIQGIASELTDYVFVSDKIDELHEQMIPFYEDSLAEFPEELWGEPITKYFDWVGEQLTRIEPEKGGMELLLFEAGIDDNLVAVIVYSKDQDSIIALSKRLKMNLVTPAQAYRY
jgi:regulatory protein YycH of two-component signal transduction system YycFG